MKSLTFILICAVGDVLIKQSGLLLQQIEAGFVQTGILKNNVMFYDRINTIDVVVNWGTCDEDERKQLEHTKQSFFNTAKKQLKSAGFEYLEELADESNPVIKLHARGCDCQNEKCSCVFGQNPIQYELSQPGTYNLVLDLANSTKETMLKLSSSNSDRNTVIIRVETTKRSCTITIAANDHIKTASISMVIQLVKVSSFSIKITCFFKDESDKRVKITATLTQKPKRTRRSWFFGLTTEKEVNAKIYKAEQAETKTDVKIINKLTKELRHTDISIAHSAEEMNNLYKDICNVGKNSKTRISTLELDMNIQRSVDKLIKTLQSCALGNIPETLNNNVIMKLCEKSMSEKLCNQLKHRIHQFMKCKIIKTHILKSSYMVEMQIETPMALSQSYKLMKSQTIPVYSQEDDLYHELAGFQKLTMMMTADSKVILLDDCAKKNKITICQTSQNQNHGLHMCVNQLVSKRNAKCHKISRRPYADCYVKAITGSLLVSTKQPVQVHQYNEINIFKPAAKLVNGVSLILNNEHYSNSIECQSLISSTKLTAANNITIITHSSFNWTDSVPYLVDPDLERQLETNNRNIQQNIKDLNSTMLDDINGVINNWKFMPKERTPRAFTITGILLIIVFGILVGCLLCRICGKYRTKQHSIINTRRIPLAITSSF